MDRRHIIYFNSCSQQEVADLWSDVMIHASQDYLFRRLSTNEDERRDNIDLRVSSRGRKGPKFLAPVTVSFSSGTMHHAGCSRTEMA
jgi:hypothetical protein